MGAFFGRVLFSFDFWHRRRANSSVCIKERKKERRHIKDDQVAIKQQQQLSNKTLRYRAHLSLSFFSPRHPLPLFCIRLLRPYILHLMCGFFPLCLRNPLFFYDRKVDGGAHLLLQKIDRSDDIKSDVKVKIYTYKKGSATFDRCPLHRHSRLQLLYTVVLLSVSYVFRHFLRSAKGAQVDEGNESKGGWPAENENIKAVL